MLYPRGAHVTAIITIISCRPFDDKLHVLSHTGCHFVFHRPQFFIVSFQFELKKIVKFLQQSTQIAHLRQLLLQVTSLRHSISDVGAWGELQQGSAGIFGDAIYPRDKLLHASLQPKGGRAPAHMHVYVHVCVAE
jgi:hypothetical protein